MPPLPALPKSDLEVARIVWRQEKASARDVTDELGKIRDVDFWTVQIYLRRLEKKDYLKATERGCSNIHSPLAKPKKIINDTTNDFVKQLFDSDAFPLFQHRAENKDLNHQQIDELQQLLDKLRDEKSEYFQLNTHFSQAHRAFNEGYSQSTF